MTSTTAEFAERIEEIASGSVPDSVLSAAAGRCSDILGRALSARGEPGVAAIARAVRGSDSSADLPVPGQDGPFDLEAAALLLGAAAAVGSRSPLAAPAGMIAAVAAVIPTAIHHRVDGRRTLEAMAVGSEIAARLESGLAPALGRGRWDASGVCGVVAAGVASSVVLGLRATSIGRAVGIAASQTVGIDALVPTGIGPLHAGKAASNGVLAAHLAAEGFTAADDPLGKSDGYLGYFAIFGHDRGPDLLLEGLGDDWADLATTPGTSGGRNGWFDEVAASMIDAADLSDLEAAIRSTSTHEVYDG